MNKAALGELVNVQPSTIEPGLTSLGDCLLHIDRMERHALEEAVVKSGLTPLLYMDLTKYDETH